jgi:hypothetical protein
LKKSECYQNLGPVTYQKYQSATNRLTVTVQNQTNISTTSTQRLHNLSTNCSTIADRYCHPFNTKFLCETLPLHAQMTGTYTLETVTI